MGDDTPFESDYYTQLGAFVSHYALAENALRLALFKIAGLDGAMGTALLSGAKTEQASSFIRRCYTAKNQALHPLLERALMQMLEITKLRNDILHHSVDLPKFPVLVSNRGKVLSEKAIRETLLSSADLHAATLDCVQLMLVFFMTISPLTDEQEREINSSAWTWRYKWREPGHTDRP